MNETRLKVNEYLAPFLVKAPYLARASVKASITFTQLCGTWHYPQNPLIIVLINILYKCGINVPMWQRRAYART